MSKKLNLIGQPFGKLKVIAPAPSRNGRTYWLCECECGVRREIATANLRHARNTKSCGCLRQGHVTHGMYHTKEGGLYKAARWRAKRDHLEFELSPHDIHIPDTCPLLGIPLDKTIGKRSPNSPSIDRKDPSLGYTKANTWIISFKANVIKNNATPEELMRIAVALKQELEKNKLQTLTHADGMGM